MKNINVSVRFMQIFSHDGRILRVYGECLEDRLYILKAKTSVYPYLFWQGNWSPYALLDFENAKELMLLEYLRYCEFYEFDPVHLYQEKEVFLWLTQRGHSQIPKYPFFNCSNHQSSDTQELCTNELICSQYREQESAFPYKSRDRLVWQGCPLLVCFLVWCPCGRYLCDAWTQ